MEVSGQPHVPAALTLVPIGYDACMPQSRSGRGGEEKTFQYLPALEPTIIQPIAQRYTTELSWLLNLDT
jgi:hypothetical protein